MNLTRQRDDLKAGEREELLSKWQLGQALSCPVFVCHSNHNPLTNEEFEFLQSNLVEDGFPTNPPYQIFRISYTNVPIYEQWFIDEETALCYRSDTGYSMAGRTVHSLHCFRRNSKQVKLWATLDGIRVDTTGSTWRAGNLRCDMTKKEISHFINSPLEYLSFFLLDVMTPKNTVIKVTPDPKGRSVEWVKAREHYLVVSRKQAVAIRERKTGPTDHELKRAAHWRIAHFRRLQSEKFKHKRGLLVPVKEAWIGPKEWIGTDGKIYKVQNV